MTAASKIAAQSAYKGDVWDAERLDPGDVDDTMGNGGG
jgi:hypothetical protein